MNLELRGKSALITGGSRGIGLGIAHALAAEGVILHLVGRSKDNLARAAETIKKDYGGEVYTHAIDIAQRGAAEQIVKAAPDIDILVNNAGATPAGDLLSVDEEAWRSGWDIKIFGCINFSRAYYALMAERRSGVIINIVGISSDRVEYDYIAGCSGNAAIAAFTRTLGGRSLEHGIRVVGISPGTTETDRATQWYIDQAEKEFGDPDVWRKFTVSLPLKRPGTPEEIGAAVAFVASPRASYISGTILSVDGGYTHAAGL